MHLGSVVSAIIALSFLSAVEALEASSHRANHGSLARKHMHRLHRRELADRNIPVIAEHDDSSLSSNATSRCAFPQNAGLIAVTPNAQNAGWAMSPDQPCKPNMFCPYACPPGKQMAQWDPSATSYSYPKSMNGGLKCDGSGAISKPFPEKPYCVDGHGTVSAKNSAGKDVAWCQTVLPGNEAMLIPTNVKAGGSAIINVPGMEYWAGTAAHYYINGPGVSTSDGCVWGTKQKPIGNWAPYVAGANVGSNGTTFVKIGWNPIYLEQATPFRSIKPKFGIKITCSSADGCSGLPCAIDPSKDAVNAMEGPSVFTGAGGATGCTIGVTKGHKAVIETWEVAGGY